MRAYVRAVRSFFRGRDGLSESDQIERNLIVVTGNLVIVVVLLGVALLRRFL